MTKSAPADEDFGFEDERDWDGWDGTETTVTACRFFVRSQRPVKPGQRVPFRASQTDGEWRGPEAEHLQDLMSIGVIAEAAEAVQQRARRQAARDAEVGVYDLHEEKNSDGVVVSRYTLASLTEEESLKRQMPIIRKMLQGGPEAVKRRDRAERTAATRELAEALVDAGLGPQRGARRSADEEESA
jgi:hypothetical protein